MNYRDLIGEPYNARLALTTPALSEPVSAEELSKHSRIDFSEDAGYLAGLIAASRQWVEQYTGRQLINATWTLTLDRFPASSFDLPRPPLVSVTSVKYYDSAYVLQTVAVASYKVLMFAGPEAPPGKIELAVGYVWPSPVYARPGAVQIALLAGYGATAATVPAQIKHAILLHAGELYERREQVVVGVSTTPAAITVERLLWPLRVW
jgi:uncharacterized phiE125 gp8 family phage protein